MKLLGLLTQYRHDLQKVAMTNGGEYAGSCPFCEGRDRFRVWPEEGDGGRYWCRQCERQGDAIQYLRDFRGMGYREACLKLEIGPKYSGQRLKPRKQNRAKLAWTPRGSEPPGDLWREKAQAFLNQSQGHLWSDQGASIRAWLHGRGLTDLTIRRAVLGLNPHDFYRTRESWGLPTVTSDKTGEPKKLWVPMGLVLPRFLDGQVVRLRIRRSEPVEGGRYILVPGSDSQPMTWASELRTAVIVESELDGLLLWQEVRDLTAVVALGSAQARPDHETHDMLVTAEVILLALDHDQAGARASWQWWAKQYPQAVRWPVPLGKDPGEAYQAGLNIRAWTKSGLARGSVRELSEGDDAYQSNDQIEQVIGSDFHQDCSFGTFPQRWLEIYDKATLERLAIMTVDGGLTDQDALRVTRVVKTWVGKGSD